MPQEAFYNEDISLPGVVQQSANDTNFSTSFGDIEDDLDSLFPSHDFENGSNDSASFGGKSFHLLSNADERIAI